MKSRASKSLRSVSFDDNNSRDFAICCVSMPGGVYALLDHRTTEVHICKLAERVSEGDKLFLAHLEQSTFGECKNGD